MSLAIRGNDFKFFSRIGVLHLIAKHSFNFNFNFNLVESWDGFILHSSTPTTQPPNHPPNRVSSERNLDYIWIDLNLNSNQNPNLNLTLNPNLNLNTNLNLNPSLNLN